MISILAASVVGSWTYAGFLAEPTPAPAPAPPSPPPASAPIVPAPAESERPAEPPRPESPAPPPPPATKPSGAPPIGPRPTLYRSTDASGQAWEHPDAAYLSSFIEARNRSFAAYSLAPPAPYHYGSPRYYLQSPCSGGRCN